MPRLLQSTNSGTLRLTHSDADIVANERTHQSSNKPAHHRANHDANERSNRVTHKQSICSSDCVTDISTDESANGSANRGTDFQFTNSGTFNQQSNRVPFGGSHSFSNCGTDGNVQRRSRFARLQHCSLHQCSFCRAVPSKVPGILLRTYKRAINSVSYIHTHSVANIGTSNHLDTNSCAITGSNYSPSTMQWRERQRAVS